MVQAIVTIIGTTALTLVGLYFIMRRTIQTVLNDVGEQLNETFAQPNVKRAMSILGQKSGDVRALQGAENAIAEGILNNITPEVRILLDKIAPNIIEDYGADTVMVLIAKYMPLIQQFLGKGLKGSSTTSKYGEQI